MDDLGRRRLRKPGNKVVRRRVESQQIMELPPPPSRRPVPSVHSNAKRFAAAYIALVLVGAILLSTPLSAERQEWTPFVDALFTAISATAVTGLITVDTQDHWNFFGELLILIMIQLGGMGFMVGASLVLLTMRRSSSLRGSLIVRDGAPTVSVHEAGQLSRKILKFMLITEAIGALILAIEFYPSSRGVWQSLWFGLFHAVSAFCNAGFDLQGDERSLVGFRDNWFVNLTIMSLIQMGALSFMVFGDLWSKRRFWQRGRLWSQRYWSRLSLDTKLVVIANYSLILIGAVTFAVIEWDTALSDISNPFDRALASVFQSVSARTAGFATISYDTAHAPTLFLWIGLMLIGGAAGSTAGGIKLTTFALLVLAVISTVRGQTEPQFSGRGIPTQLVFRAMTIAVLFVTVHFLVTLSLAVTEDVIGGRQFGFLPLMFETMSALATVGITTGITGDITTAGKLVLCVAMFVGRLGPLTVMYALQQRETPKDYSYPDAYDRLG